MALPAAALAGVTALGLARLARRRIGGVSDVLGAVQQVGEIPALLVAVAAGTWVSPVSSLIGAHS